MRRAEKLAGAATPAPLTTSTVANTQRFPGFQEASTKTLAAALRAWGDSQPHDEDFDSECKHRISVTPPVSESIAPRDVPCIGSGNQQLYVIPSLDLIVVRRGEGGRVSDGRLLRLLLGKQAKLSESETRKQRSCPD